MQFNGIFPWQQAQWQKLQALSQQHKLAHALLFHGPAGTGKVQFARALFQWLQCQHPTSQGACGHCAQCRWFEQDYHPDSYLVQPETPGKTIGIDQLRALTQALQLKSREGGYKTALIVPADKMLVAAANSLLKTLEEPAPLTLLVMITDHPGKLLATLRSRCQLLRFPPVDAQTGVAWLQQQCDVDDKTAQLALSASQYAPLHALQLITEDGLQRRSQLFDLLEGLIVGRTNPLHAAEQWLKADFVQPLYWMRSALTDLLRLKHCSDPPFLNNPDKRVMLTALAQTADLWRLHRLGQSVNKTLQLAETTVNNQLLAETIAVQMQQLRNSQ